jgi:hypothetical protein
MNGSRRILGGAGKSGTDQPPPNPIEFMVDLLMRNLCDIGKCLPILERAGISREAISKTYNLTVIACALWVLEATLSREQLPNFYILSDGAGSGRDIRFEDCETYQTAKRLVKNYGQAYVVVASASGQMKALNWCFNQLGEKARENIHRIRLLPPRLPPFGQAESKARLLPAPA